MITKDDFNYSNEYYEHDKDGNLLDGNFGRTKEIAKAVAVINNDTKKFIPTKIFAQDGILRSVYKTNSWWKDETNPETPYKPGNSYNEYFTLFKNTISSDVKNLKVANSLAELQVVCVRPETACNKLEKYINPSTNNNQGIGSRSRIYRT